MICWTVCQQSTVIELLWDISTDWERLQGMTTLHGKLITTYNTKAHDNVQYTNTWQRTIHKKHDNVQYTNTWQRTIHKHMTTYNTQTHDNVQYTNFELAHYKAFLGDILTMICILHIAILSVCFFPYNSLIICYFNPCCTKDWLKINCQLFVTFP